MRIGDLDRPQAPSLELIHAERGGIIGGFDVSPDGSLGASAYEEGYIRVWDLKTAEQLQMMWVFVRASHSIAFSPDGSRLAAGSNDREAVKLWETAAWQEVVTLAGEGTLFLFCCLFT